MLDLPRARLASHPWSLSGGGAGAVVAALEESEERLVQRIEPPIGRAIRAGADEVYMRPARVADIRVGLMPLMRGDIVRDWGADPAESIWFPYSPTLDLPRFRRDLWGWRTALAARRTFQGDMAAAGLAWWDYPVYAVYEVGVHHRAVDRVRI